MKRELELLSNGNAAPGISAWPHDDGSSLDVLDAEICGAADTPYEGGVFRLEVNIPSEYPLKPPRVRFITPIYHPNIDSQGRICLDTLTMPPKGAWKPSLNISTLLTTIQALMSSPNPDDGLMVEITEEFRRNPALFQKKAREYTKKHATSRDVESSDSSAVERRPNAGLKPIPAKQNKDTDEIEIKPVNASSADDAEGDGDESAGTSRLKKKPRLH